MRKIFSFTLFSVLLIIAACGSGGDKKETKKETEQTKETDITQNPDYQAGLALVAKSDCFTCHEIDAKKTGPPYREVANKYASYPDTIVSHLADKVIKGGSGVWGAVPMLPHPALSKQDAEAMVKYVLLLKK